MSKKTKLARVDADVLIIETTIDESTRETTTVIIEEEIEDIYTYIVN